MPEPGSPPHRTPVVTFVGTSDECTARFLSRLVHGDGAVESQIPAPGEVLRWTLDTKYYVADVAGVFHSLPRAYLDAGDISVDTPLVREIATNAEALVLCYDPTRRDAFDAVSRFAEDIRVASSSRFQEDHGDGDDWDGDSGTPEIRLLVGLYGDVDGVRTEPGIEKNGPLERAKDWSATRGYEAIAAGANEFVDRAVAARRAESGDDDCSGAKRVREALEAHAWPGLTMKTRSKATPRTAGEGVSGFETGFETASGRTPRDSKRASVGSDDSLPDGTGKDVDDVDVDDLEIILAEMARVRAAAAGASDETRRKAAAEAATRMMRAFNLGEEEDDDDEEDDDEDEDDEDEKEDEKEA